MSHSLSNITSIKARQILDSRGNPTVEADVYLANGLVGRASVPSGASTGSKEAMELRDHEDNNFDGKSVHLACKNVQEKIAPLLRGDSVLEQEKIDQKMLQLDATENKSSLGANAMLAVSLACARAGALYTQKSLFRYLKEELQVPAWKKDFVLPMPLMNIINGGAHAANNLDVQEFMIVPHLKDKPYRENLRAGIEIFHALKKVLSNKKLTTSVGDEGGFAPDLKNNAQALDLILVAIKNAGYEAGREISLALDVAASEFYDEKTKKYQFENESYGTSDLLNYYEELTKKYPIYSIEDGMSEFDISGHQKLNEQLGRKILTIGDDLYVTNKKILARGIEGKWSNSILIKVNQIGTLTETFATLDLAQKNNLSAIISHRSGETADSFIADLAVASSCGHIKTGSGCRSDRVEKYNQLIRIEEELGLQASYFANTK